MYRPTPTPNTMMRTVELEKARKTKNLADFIRQMIGENVVIASKNGVLYEGILVNKEHGFLVLKDSTIRGSKYTAKVGFLLVKQDIIQHIHSKPQQLIENKTTQ